MKYRIAKRKDNVLSKYFYYIECRNYFWNNWTPLNYPTSRFVSLEDAQKEIETIKNIEYFYQ